MLCCMSPSTANPSTIALTNDYKQPVLGETVHHPLSWKNTSSAIYLVFEKLLNSIKAILEEPDLSQTTLCLLSLEIMLAPSTTFLKSCYFLIFYFPAVCSFFLWA